MFCRIIFPFHISLQYFLVFFGKFSISDL